jgi:hypothetical protein
MPAPFLYHSRNSNNSKVPDGPMANNPAERNFTPYFLSIRYYPAFTSVIFRPTRAASAAFASWVTKATSPLEEEILAVTKIIRCRIA